MTDGRYICACRTFVGIVELQPTKLLEEGLRERLAQRTAHAAAALLAFSNHPTPIAYPPLTSFSQSTLTSIFGAGASLTADIPGRCRLPLNQPALCLSASELPSLLGHLGAAACPELCHPVKDFHVIFSSNTAGGIQQGISSCSPSIWLFPWCAGRI